MGFYWSFLGWSGQFCPYIFRIVRIFGQLSSISIYLTESVRLILSGMSKFDLTRRFLTRQFTVMVSRILLKGFLRSTVYRPCGPFCPVQEFLANLWKLLNHLTLFSESTLRSLIILIKQTSPPFPPFKWFTRGLPVPLLK